MRRKTRDGKEIDIKDMSTEHIANCIRRIELSSYSWRGEYYKELLTEFKKRDGHEKYMFPVMKSWETELTQYQEEWLDWVYSSD